MHPSIFGYVQERREVVQPPQFTPALRNVRPVEAIFPHQSPDTPRQGDIPSRPARMPIVTFTNIAGIQSVMENAFGGKLWAPAPGAQTLLGPGNQAEWVERTNIYKPKSTAYGSMFELAPPPQYA